LPDKLKAQMAMRGDQLIRMYKKKGLLRPLSYSPTVSTLTHNTVFQLSINPLIRTRAAESNSIVFGGEKI
jgi:hypothetical protein